MNKFGYRVRSLNSNGVLSLLFETEMRTNFNHSLINETDLTLKIILSDLTLNHLKTNNYTDLQVAEMTSFTWHPISFEGRELKLKLTFSNPIILSQTNDFRDKI